MNALDEAVNPPADETTNVFQFVREGFDPETILRNLLAGCAEIRSRGREPYFIVLFGETEMLPIMTRTKMLNAEAAACLVRLELEVHRMFRTTYPAAGEAEP